MDALPGDVPCRLEVDPDGRFLVVRLMAPHRSLASTLVGGGLSTIDSVTWSSATSRELTREVDARAWLEESIDGAGCVPGRTVGFITSRRLHAFVVEAAPSTAGSVTVVATAGASNALRAGDPVPTDPWRPGTINIAVILPCSLLDSAMVEVTSLASEAKAAAVADSGIRSIVSGELATGTGTDAVGVLAPAASAESADPVTEFAGKHTSLGSAIGLATYRAVRRALDAWVADQKKMGRPTLQDAPQVTSLPTAVVLVGGGVRSGKSAFAEARALDIAEKYGAKPAYIATAQAYDDEMRDRIARHREDRGDRFLSVEEPVQLPATLRAVASGSHVGLHEAPGAILVDCLTLWLSNLLCQELDDAAIGVRCDELVDVLRRTTVPIVLVSNEVGLGIVPESPMGRRFRDLAGRLHQSVAEVSDECYLAILGTTLRLHPGPVEMVCP